MAPATKLSSKARSNDPSFGWANARLIDDETMQRPLVPFQQSHTIKCTKEDCEQLFATEKEMRRHKKYDPDHFYCHRCKVDCEDWEDLTRHKVEEMAPYLDGRIEIDETNLPKHIVCEFCGEEFRSFGGRKIHRTQAHPADQDVECPGCQSHFIRAAHMIDHIESNMCSVYRAWQLRQSICQKYVVKQIMKAPEKVRKQMATLIDGTETYDQDEGGVSLLDRPTEGEAQMAGYEPLHVATHYKDISSPTTSNIGSLAKSMQSMSLGANDSEYEQAYPYASGQDSVNDKQSASGTTKSIATASSKPSAWNKPTNASKTLFPKAKPTPSPKPGDWTGMIAQREKEALGDDSGNLLKAHWWNPSAPDYNLQPFFNAGMGVFNCPFPDCLSDGMAFYAEGDLQEHIRMFHLPDFYQCPNCFKRFSKASALVAHAESTQKCTIRASGGFKSLIDEISGGLLDAKSMPIPKIYRPEAAVVKYGKQVSHGIMDTKFIGKQPNA